MKRVIFMTMIMCITLSVMAQEYEIYRCELFGSRIQNMDNEWPAWEESNVNMLIRMCINERKIEFNTEANTVIYFSEKFSEKKGTDSEGDDYVEVAWSGYDQDGVKCLLVSKDFINLASRIFVIKYAQVEAYYSCEILNPKSKEESTSVPTANNQNL